MKNILILQSFPRSYTSHEMVDEVGIIHMNDRIYDPRLGRFLQAAPFIQAATFTQSLNRYAYVWNNPLNSTDPSGYFSRSGQRYLKRIGGMVLTIVAAVVCNACAAAVKMMVAAAALNGADSEGILIAAVTAAAMSGIVSLNLNPGLTAFAIGAVGGIAAHLQGGFFGHGFMSAAMGSAIGGATSGIQDLGMRAGVSAIVGGTISKATGGKFANGAVSAAFSAAISGALSGRGSHVHNEEDVDGDIEYYEKDSMYDDETNYQLKMKLKDQAKQFKVLVEKAKAGEAKAVEVLKGRFGPKLDFDELTHRSEVLTSDAAKYKSWKFRKLGKNNIDADGKTRAVAYVVRSNKSEEGRIYLSKTAFDDVMSGNRGQYTLIHELMHFREPAFTHTKSYRQVFSSPSNNYGQIYAYQSALQEYYHGD